MRYVLVLCLWSCWFAACDAKPFDDTGGGGVGNVGGGGGGGGGDAGTPEVAGEKRLAMDGLLADVAADESYVAWYAGAPAAVAPQGTLWVVSPTGGGVGSKLADKAFGASFGEAGGALVYGADGVSACGRSIPFAANPTDELI